MSKIDLVVVSGEHEVWVIDDDLGIPIRKERRPFSKLIAVERRADGTNRLVEIQDGGRAGRERGSGLDRGTERARSRRLGMVYFPDHSALLCRLRTPVWQRTYPENPNPSQGWGFLVFGGIRLAASTSPHR
jgi:hypothetical protein